MCLVREAARLRLLKTYGGFTLIFMFEVFFLSLFANEADVQCVLRAEREPLL